MTQEQMTAMVVHPEWEDGRVGFEWCRLDRVIEQRGSEKLHAELTWNDNRDDKDEGNPVLYTHPQLLLQRTRWPAGDTGDYNLVQEKLFQLNQAQARAVAEASPFTLLGEYATAIASLWDGRS